MEDSFDFGSHEVLEIGNNGEAELFFGKKKCEKGHTKLYAVTEISKDKLPHVYRTDDFMKFLKVMSDLTVKIDVNYVSDKRPKLWKGKENSRYPGWEKRGKKASSSGSGRIADVFPNETPDMKCYCSECEIMDPVEKETWMVWIFTATHVVYDDSEAEHSECIAFYDETLDNTRDKSYANCKRIRLESKLWSNEEGDVCLLAGSTCDQLFAKNIKQTIKEFNDLWTSFRKQYIQEKDNKYKRPLVVIVSHPHGGPKKISFSRMRKRKELFIDKEKGWLATYKASTCVGSSGAPVYIFGQDYFKDEILHSRSNKYFNYSTTWCPESEN